jgi:hypothetical protein
MEFGEKYCNLSSEEESDLFVLKYHTSQSKEYIITLEKVLLIIVLSAYLIMRCSSCDQSKRMFPDRSPVCD